MLINCLIVIVCCYCLVGLTWQQQQRPLMPMPGPMPMGGGGGGPTGPGQQQSPGASLQLSIYQFLKQNKDTARFASLVDSIAQTTGDPMIVNILSGQQTIGGSSGGITVFVPVNEALGLVPTDQESLRNDLLNFIVREALPLERLASMNGQNISRTYGFKPNYMFRVVPNPYYINQRQSSSAITGTSGPSPVMYQQQQGNGQQQLQQPQQTMNMPNMMPNQQPGMQGPQSMMPPPQQSQPTKRKRQQFSTNLPDQQPSMPFPQQMPIGSIGAPPLDQQQQQQQPIQNGQPPLQNDQDMNRQFQQGQQYSNQMNGMSMQGGASVYDQYAAMYGPSGVNQDPLGISSKLPKDQLYLLNAAVIIDTYQLTNGVVYLLNSYPRYYDKSFLKLLEDGDVNGLAQNLNFWITRATQSYRMGHENLRNALNAYGPNTYFLPSDQAINSFNNRELLTNGSFLFDVLFRSHRISNQLLFDYYLNDPAAATILTDTGMPVSVSHRINSGQNEIEVSIGHVKGKIYPVFRNIYCATGVIHLIDSVLGVPSLSAYQQIASNQELTIFRAIIDRSSKYRQLLELSPGFQYQFNNFNYNQQYKRQHNKNKQGGNQTIITGKEKRQQPPVGQGFGPNGPPQYGNNVQGGGYNNGQQQQPPYNGQQPMYNNVGGGQPPYNGNNNANNPAYNANNNGIISGSFQYLTILAPRDASMIAIRDVLLSNQSAIDEFLAKQIIVDGGGNRVFYTDHDENTFQNGQTYTTLHPNQQLVATVIQNPNLPSNIVSFSPVNNPTVISRITYGNVRVMNGVVHIVDKPLSYLAPYDVTSILEKYASINSPGIRPFNQFVDILRNTGIFNDLREPTKQYTLFIPTNDALSRYKDILNSNDIQQQKNLIYRHMCLDQNLQSNFLNNQAGGMYNQQQQQQPPQFNQNNQGFNNNGGLICRNALGQDLTLMKDSYGLASTWQGHAYSKVIDDFSGIYSSAYVLEQPLLNQNLPNYGLNNPNSAYKQKASSLLASLASVIIMSVILF